MRVAVRHCGCLVAEQCLDHLLLRSRHRESAGEGVPEIMKAEVADRGSFARWLEDAPVPVA